MLVLFKLVCKLINDLPGSKLDLGPWVYLYTRLYCQLQTSDVSWLFYPAAESTQ